MMTGAIRSPGLASLATAVTFSIASAQENSMAPGPVANAIAREAAHLALSAATVSTVIGTPQTHTRADADWARVIAMKPGTQVIVSLRSVPSSERLFLMGNQFELTLLNIDSDLPGTARMALWLMSSRHPEDLTGVPSSAFVHENARVDIDGVFVNGVKVADLRDVVQKVHRPDITEIKMTGTAVHTLWDDFGGLFTIGTTLATIIGGGTLGYRLMSSHPPIGAVIGSVSGYYVGLAASIWMSDIAGRDRIVYRAP